MSGGRGALTETDECIRVDPRNSGKEEKHGGTVTARLSVTDPGKPAKQKAARRCH